VCCEIHPAAAGTDQPRLKEGMPKAPWIAPEGLHCTSRSVPTGTCCAIVPSSVSILTGLSRQLVTA